MVRANRPVTPMTEPSRSSQDPLVTPGQSWSARGSLNPLWISGLSECLPTPLPEPRLQDDNRSKLFWKSA